MKGAGVFRVPGPHLNCLHGLPFGWSRVAPLAERRPAHQRLVGAPPSDLAGGVALSRPAPTLPCPLAGTTPPHSAARPASTPPTPPPHHPPNILPTRPTPPV